MQEICTTPTRRLSTAAKCHDEDGREDLLDALLDAVVALRADKSIDDIEAILNDVIVAFYTLRASKNPNAETELFSLRVGA